MGRRHATLAVTPEAKLSWEPRLRNRKSPVSPALRLSVPGSLTVAMTGRGTPNRFLTSVLHNGLGRYVQQLQRLSLSLSRDAPPSRGAR